MVRTTHYTCKLCGKRIPTESTIRIKKEIYAPGKYKWFQSVLVVNLCIDCYDNIIGNVIDNDEYDEKGNYKL